MEVILSVAASADNSRMENEGDNDTISTDRESIGQQETVPQVGVSNVNPSF